MVSDMTSVGRGDPAPPICHPGIRRRSCASTRYRARTGTGRYNAGRNALNRSSLGASNCAT